MAGHWSGGIRDLEAVWYKERERGGHAFSPRDLPTSSAAG